MPPTTQSLSDLVRDSEIEATVFQDYTTQVIYRAGRSARQRLVRIEERWVREGSLGHGAYGTVYKERCGDRVRAIKEIKKSVVAGEKIDYNRELEAIAKFSHPKYAHCFVHSDGWFEYGDAVFITMEYLKYGDLQRYLTRPLPEAEAKDIVFQVLEGLKHMHDNRFVHRDLKPGNIMVVEKGPVWWIKIADFGISKRRHELTSLQTLQRGTFGFAAPEAVGFSSDERGAAHVTALDMWSLGAVAFRIMTNTGAFPNFIELAEYCSEKRKFPADRLKACGISDAGQDFVTRLMLLKPEKRPLADQARQHQWIQTRKVPEADVSRAGMNIETRAMHSSASDLADVTTASEPSASWGFSDRSEPNTIVRPPSNYRSPTVEDWDGESDDEVLPSQPESPDAATIFGSPNENENQRRDMFSGPDPRPRMASQRDESAAAQGEPDNYPPRETKNRTGWRSYPLVIVQDEEDKSEKERVRAKKSVRFKPTPYVEPPDVEAPYMKESKSSHHPATRFSPYVPYVEERDVYAVPYVEARDVEDSSPSYVADSKSPHHPATRANEFNGDLGDMSLDGTGDDADLGRHLPRDSVDHKYVGLPAPTPPRMTDHEKLDAIFYGVDDHGHPDGEYLGRLERAAAYIALSRRPRTTVKVVYA